MRRTFVFLPPLRTISGGLAVLLDTAVCLADAGEPVTLVLREPGATLLALPPELPVVSLTAAGMGPGDVYLVPEGWPNALAPGLTAKARCLVYCQNWAYLWNGLPDGVDWDNLPVSFLAVSDPVAQYIGRALGTVPPVLRPGIDPARFYPPGAKPAPHPVRVGFMPRKNKALAGLIRRMADARARRTGLALDWVPIDGLPPDGVAEALRGCHVFLATGFPEGCPLPPLEAMACGCVVAGFTGFGGFDYMRQASEGGHAPSVPLREVAWVGNGFYAADNDVFGATACLEAAAKLWTEGSEALARVLENGKKTAAAYGVEKRREAVARIWAGLGG